MDHIPHPRLIGFTAGVLVTLFLGTLAGVVMHEPPGPPPQVYIIE